MGPFSCKGSQRTIMSNAAASSDPQYFTELTQTMPSLEKYLVHTTPSQMAAVYWDAPSFVPRNSTTRNPANVELPLVGDLPLDFSDRESPWSGPESSFPLALHAQLTPEGPGCFQGIELSYCDPFPPATHQQLVLPALQPIGPRPLDYDSGTAPVTPGIVMEQPPAPHTAIPPAPSPDPSANRPAEYTENLWQFLGVRGRQYECLRDDGSKGVCGYLGSLAKIKRHVRDSHNSKRYALGN